MESWLEVLNNRIVILKSTIADLVGGGGVVF